MSTRASEYAWQLFRVMLKRHNAYRRARCATKRNRKKHHERQAEKFYTKEAPSAARLHACATMQEAFSCWCPDDSQPTPQP